jgi:hypothetical protein
MPLSFHVAPTWIGYRLILVRKGLPPHLANWSDRATSLHQGPVEVAGAGEDLAVRAVGHHDLVFESFVFHPRIQASGGGRRKGVRRRPRATMPDSATPEIFTWSRRAAEGRLFYLKRRPESWVYHFYRPVMGRAQAT